MFAKKHTIHVCFLVLLSWKLNCLGAEMTNFTCDDLDCQPSEICVCQGSNITIPWVIPHQGDFVSADWSFQNSTHTTTIDSDDKTTFDGNGSITLISVTPEDAGIYRCAVAYTIYTHPSMTGSVTISVNAAPTGLNYTSTESGNNITFQCTAAYLGFPSASLNIIVNGENMSSDKAIVMKDKEQVQCCLFGSSIGCIDGISNGNFCILVQRSSDVSGIHTGLSGMEIMGIVLGVVFSGLLVLVPVIFGICYFNKREVYTM